MQRKELRNVSQVQNRVSSEETGEEELKSVTKALKDTGNYQLNEAGGPLGEEFKK